MLRIVDCVANEHDFRLALLAGVLCLFACTTAISLIGRARVSSGQAQMLWIAGAGFVGGSGIWATHFVAMLAYEPGFTVDFDLTLTIVSIVVAIALCTAGFALAIRERVVVGGMVAGLAVSLMHYVGMAGLRVPANEVWNQPVVAASVATGAVFATIAVAVALRRKGLRAYFAASVLLTFAICGMHFTGMAAVRFSYNPLIVVPDRILEPETIAVAIATVATLIIGIGLAMAVIDYRIARHAKKEAAVLRDYVTRLESAKEEQEKSLADRAAALTEAAAANKAKSDFLAAMSHELRTPLNAIIGFSEMMTTQMFGPLGDHRYRTYAFDIHNSGTHLLSLINDILDLSQLDARKTELFEESVQIAGIVADACRMVERQAEAGGVALIKDIPSDLPCILVDARRIKQVLLNVLSNAVKFTRAGGRIVVTASNQPYGVTIMVRDTGIGIKQDLIAKALENFGQINSGVARKHKGTGLGLPLAKQLIELHGGSLTLESETDVGTCVTLVIPAFRVREHSETVAA